MTDINSFEKLGRMSREGKDIRLAPLSNIVSLDKRGPKCTVTIGIDEGTFNDLSTNKPFVGGFIVADKAQFDQI